MCLSNPVPMGILPYCPSILQTNTKTSVFTCAFEYQRQGQTCGLAERQFVQALAFSNEAAKLALRALFLPSLMGWVAPDSFNDWNVPAYVPPPALG